MDNVIVKRGYRFNIAGSPSTTLTCLPDPGQLAALPDKIPHVKPRLHVAEGDPVCIGSLLFEDKRDPRFKFLSPAGGTVRRIRFGPRRTIQAIIVDRHAGPEPRVGFEALSNDALAAIDRGALVARILDGGLWWVFRELPFRDLPAPETIPPLILVGLDAKEPFSPAADVYLHGREDLFAFGLKVLSKLCGGKLVVFADAADHALIARGRDWLTHTVAGGYPSDDPGAVLYRIKTQASENRAWYVAGQDLMLLAELLRDGRYPTQRVMTVAGSAAPARGHFLTRLGTPLSHLADPNQITPPTRWIMGGMLRGHTASQEDFMGLYETALNLVPAGGQAEFLALFTPGFRKPSYSRIFLSKLNPAPLLYDCNLHGDTRACIACMHCADVCPVDLLPHMVFKAIAVEEVEEYLQLGLLDCVDCGLCSYVCPSKIELSRIFGNAKASYAREQMKKSE